jgi:hypothetical protein
MEFKEFKEAFQENFKRLTSDVDCLFQVDVDRDELWEKYLDSFPTGTNELFRERREFDCSACRHFVKNYGNIVALKNGKFESLWGFTVNDPKYQSVLWALTNYISDMDISNVFVSKEQRLGTNVNFEQREDGSVIEWHHFYLELPDKFVSRSSETVDTIKGNYRSVKDVFKRSLEEISLESVETVLELIYSNTLYKGEEWKRPLEQFRMYKKEYENPATFDEINDDDYAWECSVKAGPVIGKIRNHSIGTLLTNVTEGMELDLAVKKYEQIVAPSNYRRPKPIFTKRMLEDAQETVKELGYMSSLQRRHARLDDINVNNILYSNKDASKRIHGDIFDEMKEDIPINSKKFSKVEEIPLDKFITDILPTTRELEVFLENKHTKNMVSLIAPADNESPSMFKWNNKFSWAYTGNITDSDMKENVKMAGGNVEGVLRFSIQWNDGTVWDKNDLDAHCKEPYGNEIMFNNKLNTRTTGNLDVDIVKPERNEPAVENITWLDKSKMEEGTYQFFVHQYSNRGGKEGFKAEIEFDNKIYEFNYPHELRQNENVQVAEVTYTKAEGFNIKEKIPSTMATKEVWNVKTQQFIPVTVVMYSPNHWRGEEGTGHKHVFFMLKDCVNSEKPHGFYNEFLKQDLAKHRKVFEAIGSRMAVEDVADQLSGVGFSTTRRNEVLVKVKGQTERIFKIKF